MSKSGADELRLRGFATGDLPVATTTRGDIARLARPADYATTEYILSIDQTTGLPAWRVLAVADSLTGFGMDFGDSFGQD